MGVNMAGKYFDDEACCEASKQEIIRHITRQQTAASQEGEVRIGVYKIELLMKQAKFPLKCAEPFRPWQTPRENAALPPQSTARRLD